MATTTRRGSVMIYIVLSLPVFAGICLLAVDFARVQLTKTQLMRTADAAARYAVTGASDGTALSKANWIGSQNSAAGSTVVFQAADVETGTWASNTFTAGATPANAVRVTARRTAATGNAVPLSFGFLIGAGSQNVTAKAIAVTKPYGYGVVGLNYIKMGGNASISYDSSSGVTSGHGNIASNGDITLSGSTYVQGDAAPGIGHTVIGASGRVTGSTTPLTTTLSYPNGDAGSAATINDNAAAGITNDLNLSGSNTKTVPAGTYYVHDMNIAASAVLTFSGPATVYVYHNLTISGQVLTSSNLARNLTIIMCDDTGGHAPGPVKVTSNADLYATIYSPENKVTLQGNGDIYGSIVGLSIDMTGTSGIHYDISLNGGGGISLVQ